MKNKPLRITFLVSVLAAAMSLAVGPSYARAPGDANLKLTAVMSLVDGHADFANRVLPSVKNGQASEEDKAFIRGMMKRMSEEEAEIYKALSEADRAAVQKHLTTRKVTVDLKAAGKALGLPTPTSVTPGARIPSAASVAGFIIMSYSCCNGGGAGVMLGFGVSSCGVSIPGCP